MGRIYTKTGDYGETSIFGGARVRKSTPLIAAYGTLDELSSYLGVCRAYIRDYVKIPKYEEEMKKYDEVLKEVQHDLYLIGSHLAGKEDKCISDEHIENLERVIDRYEDKLPELHGFIIPNGNLLSAHLHVARTICRRAERKVAAIFENEGQFHTELKYVNRLSDLLFILARYSNFIMKVDEELAKY